jgi:hypothetical protein
VCAVAHTAQTNLTSRRRGRRCFHHTSLSMQLFADVGGIYMTPIGSLSLSLYIYIYICTFFFEKNKKGNMGVHDS